MEICNSSWINIYNIEKLLESEYPEVAVLRNICVSFCGMCANNPFAIVNGKRIFAKSQEECIDLIRRRIESELESFR